jgi:NAD(P)H-flavin reductase
MPLIADAAKSTPALKQITKDHPDLSGFDIYAAGPETFLTSVKKYLRDNKFPENQLITNRVD